MDKKHKLLKKYIKEANNILIISHLGPDPDAFCSMLLLKEAIKQIYPKKVVKVKARQMPNFNIPTMKDIEVVERLDEGEEDLIIIVDIPSFSLCVKDEDSLKNTSVPMMIIDHHPSGKETIQEITINEHRSSAVEQVYVTIKRIFGKKLTITKDMSEITQFGILSDTNRFMYDHTSPDTHRIFADLKDISTVDIEVFTYNSQKFPEGSLKYLLEALNNIQIDGDMAYTYIEKIDPEKKAFTNEAFRFMKDNILRYIQGVHWGFVLKPKEDENMWRISFRSTVGYQKVNRIAEELNGGGHELAAGGEIEATTAKEAVQKVLKTIEKHKD